MIPSETRTHTATIMAEATTTSLPNIVFINFIISRISCQLNSSFQIQCYIDKLFFQTLILKFLGQDIFAFLEKCGFNFLLPTGMFSDRKMEILNPL